VGRESVGQVRGRAPRARRAERSRGKNEKNEGRKKVRKKAHPFRTQKK
jgi:hypothetical protein